jgi:L-rhamnose isomerase / sugar isomerase
MQVSKEQISNHNEQFFASHQNKLNFTFSEVENAEAIIQKIMQFGIAIPSWALGTGSTRFGRFPGGGEPRNLEEKIEDVGLLRALDKTSNAISLHIPWDIPTNPTEIKTLAAQHGLAFDAVNSNTFQDQVDQKYSYKFGSLQNVNKAIRKQAVDHNIDVIKHGINLGSKSLTVWLSDGSCFPGQLNFKKAFENTLESLQEIYAALPEDWKLLVEYKAFEPNFYSMTIGDWGQSLLFANKLGKKAYTLVDLGHHLPNANIEQIVSLLMMEGKLGGFHFNDSKYGDDDLTVGSIKPYQLFLIFNELIQGIQANNPPFEKGSNFGWMIDASHNIKDPLEDLLQSVEAIQIAYAQSLLVDTVALENARENNDVAQAQEILQRAYRTDVRALVAEARLRTECALSPIQLFRNLKVRENLINVRGSKTFATGL